MNNSSDIIKNSNGIVNFNINDGRLVRLGSLEYLLRAVNVVQSGISGLTLNNIVDIVAPQKTGYFNTLKGTLQIKDGLIKTDDVVSEGNNLSLFLSGNIDMATNNADVTVMGKLSKKVSGLLGPVGSLSISSVLEYIPGIGFIPSSDKGLIDMLPGLSKIPGLGLSTKKTRRFIVNIEGDLYDPASVKRFRWVD